MLTPRFNGSANSLETVVDFYDTRFHIGFTKQEKSDLVAFLRSAGLSVAELRVRPVEAARAVVDATAKAVMRDTNTKIFTDVWLSLTVVNTSDSLVGTVLPTPPCTAS